MRTAEERFVALEVESAEQRVMVHRLEQSIGDFRAEMNRRFSHVDQRFDQVDRRFDAVDRRFLGIEGRLSALDQKFDALGKEMSVQFRWVVGLLFSALLAVVLALARG